MRKIWSFCRLCVLVATLATTVTQTKAATFTGTNSPGVFKDFSFTITSASTNLSIVVPGSSSAFSRLLLGRGVAPDTTNFDVVAWNSGTNVINLERTNLFNTNYVLRVLTPTNSGTHAFTATLTTNVGALRTSAMPATKPITNIVTGRLTPGDWQFFRIDCPTNLAGWRAVISTTNATAPDLYLQRDQLPTTTTFTKCSLGASPGTIFMNDQELAAGDWFVGVHLGSVTTVVYYTLTFEYSPMVTLTWDPGTTDAGTQIYTNTSTTGGDYYFKVIPDITASGGWRTALKVNAGEADISIRKGALPDDSNFFAKSAMVGSDGFVIPGSAFNAGETWYYRVHASAGAQWTLVSGEVFVTDLGTVADDASSGSGPVQIGPEGIRYFQTTVPADALAWRLLLNGATNLVMVKQTVVPVIGSSDQSQASQLLIVPNYLVGGHNYYVGIAGNPGTTVTLDSRKQAVIDIPIANQVSISITNGGYATYRVTVPQDMLVWQVTTIPSIGNANVAVRKGNVPSETYNDAYSEAAGLLADSVSIVPPTLANGTFYITVYGTGTYQCTLTSGEPTVTDIPYTSATQNAETNRVGWRYFKLSDINSQLGSLGWDLFVINYSPGTQIAIRRNSAPGIRNYRDPSSKSSGDYDVLGSDFLQNPGQQADVWYVGVYNPSNALGAFTLVTRPLVPTVIPMDSTTNLVNVPSKKWQFFQVTFSDADAIKGWDIRLANVTSGQPQIVVRKDLLPTSLANIGLSLPVTLSTWPNGGQWAASSDWTGRDYSSVGTNEVGRVLTFGYGRPLSAGTYYIGVINASGSTSMTYQLVSRTFGGQASTIPIVDLSITNGAATNNALAARDIAVYRTVIPAGVTSWKVKLTTLTGDASMSIAKDAVPNISATGVGTSSVTITNPATAGKKMNKAGNEHCLLLPPPWTNSLLPGTYYILVAADGITATNTPTYVGTGNSAFRLTSGQIQPVSLGTLEQTDIRFNDSLDGGEVAMYNFGNGTNSYLGYEISLEGTTGYPVMVDRDGYELPDAGVSNLRLGVSTETYGVEGGKTDGTASPGFITAACNPLTNAVAVKARSPYAPASYTIHLRRLTADPFNEACSSTVGTRTITGQTNFYHWFSVQVPTNALGWDVRLLNVTGSPKLIICRDVLALNNPITSPPFPGTFTSWPSGFNWIAGQDWTSRSYSTNGSINEDGRILAMGMGQPLQPGLYYIGVYNAGAPSPVSYTIEGSGIGNGFAIPVVDLSYDGGAATNTLDPRRAAYYRVAIPQGSNSVQLKLTALSGESMMVWTTNYLPSVLSGKSGGGPGMIMQKPGNEHMLILTNQPGVLYQCFAVVSEGYTNAAQTGWIGTNSSTFIFRSRGSLPVIDMGTVTNPAVSLFATNSLEGGEVAAYSFSVPLSMRTQNVLSVEIQLTNVVGNPVFVARTGASVPYPGQYGNGISSDTYGNIGGAADNLIVSKSSTIVGLNSTNDTVFTVAVKARPANNVYSNAAFTLRINPIPIDTTPVEFDGGSFTFTNLLPGRWEYYAIDVPTNCLGWDVRLQNVTGAPKMVVGRMLPGTFSPASWTPPTAANWGISNQWAAASDWTRRQYASDGMTVEDGRILTMSMGKPLQPGRYYVGITNSAATNASYTLLSRGIGAGLSLPVQDLDFNNGTATAVTLAKREAAYYRVIVPANARTWKVRMNPSQGEAMMVVQQDFMPCVESGRTGPGKYMQKVDAEQYVRIATNNPPVYSPPALQPGTNYIAVIAEGINPPSSTTIGTGATTFGITSLGDVGVNELGTLSTAPISITEGLFAGETKIYQFYVPAGTPAFEVRLQDKTGNPVMLMTTNLGLSDPGASVGGLSSDTYGCEGGITPHYGSGDIITLPTPATDRYYNVAVKARPINNLNLDADYTLTVRQMPVQDLVFDPEQGGTGTTSSAVGLLVDNQRIYYRVVIPDSATNSPTFGWQLNLSQKSGLPTVRVRKNLLPNDSVTGVPFTPYAAVIAPPFLTPGIWYVEVKGSNSTAFTLTSSAVTLQRPVWQMPLPGQPPTAPGLSNTDFGDSGIDTNGVPISGVGTNGLPLGDNGIDLEQGHYHFYGVDIPNTNLGLFRVELDAISYNVDGYIRRAQIPTYTHQTNGTQGFMVERSLTGTATEYGNWVPFDGKTESALAPGSYYVAVRAMGANARYRLHVSTGYIKPMQAQGGYYNNETVAGNDWRYYMTTVPADIGANWTVTLSQQAGKVAVYIRDTVPPGNGATTSSSDLKHWGTDAKSGSIAYTNLSSPGIYTLSNPPVRPGATYFLGVLASQDSKFSISSAINMSTNIPPITDIEFYHGGVTNVIPALSQQYFRIQTPADGLRWRDIATHSTNIARYIANGTLPAKSSADAYNSGWIANKACDQFLKVYPWQPQTTYYMIVSNRSALPEPFTLAMQSSDTNADDDLDGMPDAWEVRYFGNISQSPGGDYDSDGASNLNEYLEHTDPTNPSSVRPRLAVNVINGTAVWTPNQTNYDQGAVVTISVTPSSGYVFSSWTVGISGTANPVALTLTSSISATAQCRRIGDDFASRIPLVGVSNVSTTINSGCSKETGEPNIGGVAPAHSMWWTWTAPSTGPVTMKTAGSSFNTVLSVFTGNALTNLSLVVANNDDTPLNTSKVQFNATAGTTYQIAVDGNTVYDTGTIVMSVVQTAPVAPPAITAPQRGADGSFQLSFSAAPGAIYDLQGTTNLVDWVTLMSVTNADGAVPFTDYDATNFSRRFYRIIQR